MLNIPVQGDLAVQYIQAVYSISRFLNHDCHIGDNWQIVIQATNYSSENIDSYTEHLGNILDLPPEKINFSPYPVVTGVHSYSSMKKFINILPNIRKLLPLKAPSLASNCSCIYLPSLQLKNQHRRKYFDYLLQTARTNSHDSSIFVIYDNPEDAKWLNEQTKGLGIKLKLVQDSLKLWNLLQMSTIYSVPCSILFSLKLGDRNKIYLFYHLTIA